MTKVGMEWCFAQCLRDAFLAGAGAKPGVPIPKRMLARWAEYEPGGTMHTRVLEALRRGDVEDADKEIVAAIEEKRLR